MKRTPLLRQRALTRVTKSRFPLAFPTSGSTTCLVISMKATRPFWERWGRPEGQVMSSNFPELVFSDTEDFDAERLNKAMEVLDQRLRVLEPFSPNWQA